MNTYYIFKILSNGNLHPMGSYKGSTPQQAIVNMGKSGNLKGHDWTAEYHAFPMDEHFAKLRVNSAQFQSLDGE